MLTPLPLPVRVLVKGASTVSWISFMGGPRSDFAFPRAIEATLLAEGRPAEVRNTALLGTPTSDFFRTFEADVAQWSPDVVVIIAGHYETIHLFLPHWFERWANRPNVRPGRLRTVLRRRVVRGVWKVSAKVQARVDAAARPLLRRRLRAAAHDLEGYIGLVQQVGSPLVLVFELLPPAPRQAQWFPGMAARIHAINREHESVIGRIDRPNVEMLRVSEIARRVAGDDQAAATPDGFHYTPELHAEIGAELGRRIIAWADTQPHLKP